LKNLEELAVAYRDRQRAERKVNGIAHANGMGLKLDLTLAELVGYTFDAVGNAPVVVAEDGDEWCSGIQYTAGMTIVYNGKNYKVLMTHLSQDGWKPDSPGVYLFELIVKQKDEWAVNINYKVGDLVTYNGKTYVCTSLHLSQAGWYPGAPGFYFWEAVVE
jgi:chitin disaccharide deacetylase